MCWFCFTESLSWGKKSVSILVYEGQEIFSESWEMLTISHIYQDRVFCWYLRVNSSKASPQGCTSFMEGVHQLPTSAPTMSLAKPSQEEGQICQAKIWPSLMGPVTIPLSNLGVLFFYREHTSPPCPHSGRKSGRRGNHSTLSTHPQQPITEPLSRQRQEKEARG